jgi:Ca-activated chloride channel family protein
MGSDYYSLLGLPQDATAEEIRSSYFDAARRLHPDANPDPGAKEQFLLIQEAYDTLNNELKRKKYDTTLPARTTGPEISIKAKYSRSAVPMLAERQMLYVLLDLNCTAKFDSNHYPPINICIVIDKSTSMAGTRMDIVKTNTINLIRQLRPDDMISVVAFGDKAETVLQPVRAAEINRYESRIHAIRSSGATEIFQGLDAGITALNNGSLSASLKQLILITDGHTYGDETACYDLAAKCANDGITIHALGVGHEWNDVFLDKLASISGGNANFISNPKDLPKFFDQRLSAVVRVYAHNVTYDFISDPEVELAYAFRISPDITPIPPGSPVNLGSICFDNNLSVLLEFAINPIFKKKDQILLTSGKVKMEIPTKAVGIERLPIELKKDVVQNLDKESPPIAIIEAMARLTLYRMHENARKEVEVGDIDKATQHLQHLATHLLAEGNRDLAHTVLMEAEHIHQSHRFSEEGNKRIKYGTRALMLLPGSEQKTP